MRSSAEQARALVASLTVASLATVAGGGDPWCSIVVYATLADGSPVLALSSLAEHGRNLAHDPRASLAVADLAAGGDPLDRGRVTLAGRAVRPQGGRAAAALAAHVRAVPGARRYAGWPDFTLWVLEVQRVRWVGGFAEMESVSAADYAAAGAAGTQPAG